MSVYGLGQTTRVYQFAPDADQKCYPIGTNGSGMEWEWEWGWTVGTAVPTVAVPFQKSKESINLAKRKGSLSVGAPWQECQNPS